MLLDAHAHLDQYPDELLPVVLNEIAAHRILTVSVGTDLPSFERTQMIAAQSPLVVSTFGIHPAKAPAHAHRLASPEQAIADSPMLGEIGLDHRYITDASQYPAQRAVFETFLAAARDQGKIVNTHSSGAEAEALSLLARYEIRRTIVHWCDGPRDLLPILADQGAFFTVGVEVMFSRTIQAIARAVPLDRLLTETDNPDGLHWLTGAIGMPGALGDVVDALAGSRGMGADALVRTVAANFDRLTRDHPWLASWRAARR